MDIRPRTLGEICDDACRLALAEAPLFLLFNACFLVPVFTVLLLLLTQPIPSGMGQWVLPALTALLLPLTGLASAASQNLLQRRLTSSQHMQGAISPMPSLRRVVAHTTVRAVLLSLTLPGPLLLMVSFLPDTSPILRFIGFLFGSLLTFLLSFPLWIASTSVHVLLSANAGRSGTLLSELRRDVAAARGKAAVLVLSRFPLLLLLALQLHLLAKIVLWAADNLGGFDTTLLDMQLAFFEEPIYTMALFLLSWLLLTPYFECGNFLLHADVRARQEGLDLQHRVQRTFGGSLSFRETVNLNRTLTVAALIFLFGATARADESQRQTIHAIRGEVETIRTEIQETEPYPGGQRWLGRLHGLQAKLARIGEGAPRRFRWFEQALDDFAQRKKEDALRILDDMQRRLSLLEDSLAPPQQAAAQAKERRSPEDIKSLLRGSEGRKTERTRPRQRIEEDRPEVRREQERGKGEQGEAPQAGGGRGSPLSVPAASSDGFSILGWVVLGGLALAVVVVGVLLYLASPRSPKSKKGKPAASAAGLSEENELRQLLEESPAALFRQADALAGEGRFRDAVRILYLAVLALLHRQHLIRLEPTRTNGEYVRQVRLSEQAPPELHGLFERLTCIFETAWYSERLCESREYRSCRTLADEIQHESNRT